MVAWYRMELEIHHIDAGQAIGFYGPVLIRVLTTAPTDLPSLDQFQQLTELALSRWPIAGVWVVAHHGAPFPDGEFLRQVGPALRPTRDRLVAVMTPLGLGFWAKAAAVMTFTLGRLVGTVPSLETTVERGAARLGFELIGVDAEKLVASHAALLEAIQTAAKVA
jgi:hypothetical protein